MRPGSGAWARDPGLRAAGLVSTGVMRSPGGKARSAVAADVLAEPAVDIGSLLDAVVQHGAPFFGVVVQRHGTEKKAGLEDDFEGVAEIVREPANLFGLLLGDGPGRNRESHERWLSAKKMPSRCWSRHGV